jgi:hypothetical protein
MARRLFAMPAQNAHRETPFGPRYRVRRISKVCFKREMRASPPARHARTPKGRVCSRASHAGER